MTTTQQKHALALVAAEEMARYHALNNVVLRDQTERTIDDLCGYWTDAGFMWPADIAQTAGVPVLRRARDKQTA